MVDFQFLEYTAIGVGILAAIAIIGANFSTFVSVVSGEWARSLDKARAQKAARELAYGYATVNDYQNVMSRSAADEPRQTQTDEQTDRVSEANTMIGRLQLDRTKTAVIELLVYSGWDASQVRAVLKGDNGALGAEVDAARKRLGIAPEPPRQLVIRDNGGPPRSIPFTDPDYPYQAPA